MITSMGAGAVHSGNVHYITILESQGYIWVIQLFASNHASQQRALSISAMYGTSLEKLRSMHSMHSVCIDICQLDV